MANKELYKELLTAKDLNAALIDHFGFMVKSDGFEPLLEAVMAKAESVALDNDKLVIYFPNGNKMTCHEPAESDQSKWPRAYRWIMNRHKLITFPDDGGWALELGDTNSLETEIFEDSGSDFLSLFDNPADMLCPMTDYSDWWVYHPIRKNQHNEPILCLASHESSDIDALITSCSIGELFLKRVAESLDMDDLIPEIETEEPENWDAEETLFHTVSDDDVYEALSGPEKATDILAFIAGLEKLSTAGKFSPEADDYLLLHTSNIIVNCRNGGINPFPVFEVFFRLFPDARRKSFEHQLSNNVDQFLAAAKDHPEYYLQIKSRYMKGPVNDDTAPAFYRIAKIFAGLALTDEAREILKRLEASVACPTYIKFEPDDFPEPLKSEFAGLRETMLKAFMKKHAYED